VGRVQVNRTSRLTSFFGLGHGHSSHSVVCATECIVGRIVVRRTGIGCVPLQMIGMDRIFIRIFGSKVAYTCTGVANEFDVAAPAILTSSEQEDESCIVSFVSRNPFRLVVRPQVMQLRDFPGISLTHRRIWIGGCLALGIRYIVAREIVIGISDRIQRPLNCLGGPGEVEKRIVIVAHVAFAIGFKSHHGLCQRYPTEEKQKEGDAKASED